MSVLLPIPYSQSPVPMPNAFDSYREALVIEHTTIWPDTLENPPTTPAEKERIENLLLAEPAQAAELAYIRLHTGFCRQITVTAADMERLNKG
jgi:hypothetical protein